MPHVKIGYPHKAPDGTKRTQGETVYVSSSEAEGIVADGKGKIVKVSAEEAVKIAEASKPKDDKPAPKEESPKPLPKRPAPAKTEKPTDA
ncbi:hypothetical protein [Nocardiopsis tropica]|uniref:Hypervirulence associated protein TUDOR domain-containing protein n=1 Tax=Nocardiopsis tropica TaxID=109330 RepID=A0ABU7KQY3_9ACTN|nr:hypothetical protein [Nocardiopsis umidischolae]MEE2051698.1 hypothetical protein [Nocardiopsis umidischolae]